MRSSVQVLVLAMLLGACGGGDGGTSGDRGAGPSEAPPAVRAEIEATIGDYFGAATAEEVCAAVTRGFEVMLTEGAPGPDPASPPSEACPSVVEAAIARDAFVLEPGAGVEVQEVVVEQDRGAARVVQGGTPEPYRVFLFERGRRWYVTSDAAVLPGFGELAREIDA